MKLCWICPTWNRPLCLANLVRQFLAQDYPRELLQLIILDDAGQYDDQEGDRWRIITVPKPFDSLPAKYNALVRLVPSDCEGIVVAEDDDLYLPLHSAACAAALKLGDVSIPSKNRSQYMGREQIETKEFHASIAIRLDFLRSIGGWTETACGHFDQQFMQRLKQGRVVDPLTCRHNWRYGWRYFPPTYCFRWETTRHTHAQAFMGSDDWLAKARAAAGPVNYVGRLQLDEPETRYHTYSGTRPAREIDMRGNFDGES